MQTWALIVFVVLGMTFLAALSVALHMALPASVLEGANRHVRYFGL